MSRPPQVLTSTQLAARWNLSIRTLEMWRQRKQGPKYVKLGVASRNKVAIVYKVKDVESYENEHTVLASRPLNVKGGILG